MKVTVETVCGACDGTGLYQGMCEAKGTAVVCLNCDGTGCLKLSYEPFVARKERRGIREVFLSRGSFLATGVGACGKSVTYKEFQQGKMPKD